MYLFLGSYFNPKEIAIMNNMKNQLVIQEKLVNNTPMKMIEGKNFTYYIQTTNGIITKVIAKSPRKLAPNYFFIKNLDQCTNKLIFRVPLRMADWEYDCPQGRIEYKTFGVPGYLNTEVKFLRNKE